MTPQEVEILKELLIIAENKSGITPSEELILQVARDTLRYGCQTEQPSHIPRSHVKQVIEKWVDSPPWTKEVQEKIISEICEPSHISGQGREAELEKCLGELVDKVEALRPHLVEEVHPDNRSKFNDLVDDLFKKSDEATGFLI